MKCEATECGHTKGGLRVRSITDSAMYSGRKWGDGMSVVNLNQPSPKAKLFSVYHQHEYGSTHWLLWAEILPSEEQIVTALDIDFEPEKDEFIDIDEIDTIDVTLIC